MTKHLLFFLLLVSEICFAQQKGYRGTIKVRKFAKTDTAKKAVVVEYGIPVSGVLPVFPGGEEKMYEFIQENLKYPEAEKKKGIHGTVYVTFFVDKDGTIDNARIYKTSFRENFDNEALRIVKMMPKWIPGKEKGELKKWPCTMPIKFEL